MEHDAVCVWFYSYSGAPVMEETNKKSFTNVMKRMEDSGEKAEEQLPKRARAVMTEKFRNFDEKSRRCKRPQNDAR